MAGRFSRRHEMISIDELLDGGWKKVLSHIDWTAVERQRKVAEESMISRSTMFALFLPFLIVFGLLFAFLGPRVAARFGDTSIVPAIHGAIANAFGGIYWLFDDEIGTYLVFVLFFLPPILVVYFFVNSKRGAYRKLFRRRIFRPVWGSISGVSKLREKSARRAAKAGLRYLAETSGFLRNGERVWIDRKRSFSIQERDYEAHVLDVTFTKREFLDDQDQVIFRGAILFISLPDAAPGAIRSKDLLRIIGERSWGGSGGYFSKTTDRRWVAADSDRVLLLAQHRDYLHSRLDRASSHPPRR